MAATKTRAKPPKTNAVKPQSNDMGTSASCEVLTLAEAAAYLRLPEEDILRITLAQNLPGRQVGEEWRFLKSALQDWLRNPPPKPSKEAVLARIGSWKNDPYVELELEEIHKRRGRSMNEEKQ